MFGSRAEPRASTDEPAGPAEFCSRASIDALGSAHAQDEGASQGFAGSHEEREESDDDPDQDDDFDDDAETVGQAQRPRTVPPGTAWFHPSVHHDPISLGHYYFDPRPPRCC